MSAKGNRIAGLILGLGIFLGPLSAAPPESDRPFHLQAGAGAEYFVRSLAWDDDTGASTLAAGLGLARIGVAFAGGPTLSILAGFSLSDWNGLVFRELPFSVEYRAGAAGGPVLGAEAEIPLLATGAWDISAGGGILFALGSAKTWTLSGLNTDGSLDGKGRWTRIRFGPTAVYRGFETFSPFASVYYDGLWGTFTMNEDIGILSGTEKKKVRGQGVFGASLGLLVEPSPAVRLKAEGSLLPYQMLEGGLKLKAGFSFQACFLF